MELQIDFWAVVVAALSAFVLGGIWYGPIFGRQWQKLSELTDEQIEQGHKGIIFGGAFVCNFVIAFAFAGMISSPLIAEPGLDSGVTLGLVLSLMFVVMAFGINYLFSLRPLALWLIDSGYMVCLFALMGAILGAWPA